MKTYLDLYDDFSATCSYVEEKANLLLDDGELRTAVERIALVHYVRLSENEIIGFVENYKIERSRNEVERTKAR